jgi:hypothetical protein
MGMFDYIRCEVPLPDGWEADNLQTKDFDCEMVTHVITKDGRLMLERIDETHVVPKAERPYPDAPDDDIRSMCGMLRTVRSQHDSGFHGVVRFYGSEYRHLDDKPACPRGAEHQGGEVRDWTTKEPLKHIWHEYNAKFTDGQLVGIELVPYADP